MLIIRVPGGQDTALGIYKDFEGYLPNGDRIRLVSTDYGFAAHYQNGASNSIIGSQTKCTT